MAMPAIQLVAVLSQKRSSAFGLRIRPSSFIPQVDALTFAPSSNQVQWSLSGVDGFRGSRLAKDVLTS